MSGLQDRKQVSFEVAEGKASPPIQLHRTQITQELRSVVWMTIYTSLTTHDVRGNPYIGEDWAHILANKHVLRDHRMIDEFNSSYRLQVQELKAEILNSTYERFYGLIQWILREPSVPSGFSEDIKAVLEHCRSHTGSLTGTRWCLLVMKKH